MNKQISAILLLLPLLTGCMSGESGESSLIPKSSVVVTTSPSIAIAPCQNVKIDTVPTVNSFTAAGKTYHLLGVDVAKEATDKDVKDMETSLKQRGFCIKEDPAFTGRDLVYLFSAENGLLNGDVIRRGLATAGNTGDYIYKEYFKNLEKEAQANKDGVWKDEKKLAAALAQGNTVAEDTSSYALVFPQDAAQHAGETVTLRMTIGSTGQNATTLYLNSEKDYTSEANVPAVISLPAKTDLKDLVNRAPSLVGKSVDITGRIDVLNGRAQIVVAKNSDVTIKE